MILQELQHKHASHTQYTWDRSWVLPYESIWSLLHKFSVLNRISFSECKSLFKSNRARGGRVTELGLSLCEQKLTRVIGQGSPLDLNLMHRIVHPNDRASLVSANLRSCRICLRHGYHSIFHQITLIKRCPIHQIDLIKSDWESGACASPGSGEHEAHLWSPYGDSKSSAERNLLDLADDQRAALDDLYEWFFASSKIAGCGTSLKRWACTGDRPTPRTHTYERSMAEIPVLRGCITGLRPPESVVCSLRGGTLRAVAQYGYRSNTPAAGRRFSIPSNSVPQFNQLGLTCLDDKEARELEAGLQKTYKSIRRHFSKVFLGHRHRACARAIERAMWWEPTSDTTTPVCPWAFGYLFWRRHWEQAVRSNRRKKQVTWNNFLFVTITDTDFNLNRWVTLRVFALECYWTFQESVLLARGMSMRQKFSWDPALIRGRRIPYWHIGSAPNPGAPSICWWSRPTVHAKALRINVPMRRHRRDVTEQAKMIYRLPVTRS
jgi:hypothetical protein